jgi:hypothetical protein
MTRIKYLSVPNFHIFIEHNTFYEVDSPKTVQGQTYCLFFLQPDLLTLVYLLLEKPEIRLK